MKSCARCGAELRSHDAGGLCVRCLLEGGLSAPRSPPPPEEAVEAESIFPVRSFGDYQLLAEIARGGMGVVYRARQASLDRIVALKMILAGQFASKQIIQRFRGEVTAAALLQHPNIVAIHHVGLHEDQHYFSMDYVQGQNLSQLVGANPLPPDQAARYVKLAAEAIHYAHEQGVLHRDLKPSNVLIDAATDQPRITDFGLAKRLDGESSLTLTGQVLGSPNFMPPEQAGTARGKIGRQSDVYGLGAILYYLITARPPFHAGSLPGIISQVLHSEPIDPRSLNPSVPRDLETICTKCLQKEPSHRYHSAQELADELARFLRKEPIRSRPITFGERAWRWSRRNPALANLAVLLALVFALGFAGTLWQWRHAVSSARREATQRALADQLRQRAEESLYAADLSRAERALEVGDLGQARELVAAHSGQSGFGDFAWRLLWQRSRGDDLFALRGHSNFVQSVKFSPDGSAVASRSADDRLVAWDLALGTERFTIAHVAALAGFSTDGQTIVYGTRDRAVKFANAQTGSTIKEIANAGELVAVLADGQTLATTAENFLVKFWDIPSGREKDVLSGKGGLNLWGSEFGAGVVITPDGRRLAISNGLHAGITLWDLQTRKIVNPAFDRRSVPITFLSLSPQGNVLATGAFDGVVKFWDTATGAEARPSIQAHSEPVFSLAWAADGKNFATASIDQTIKLWDVATSGELGTLKGHEGAILAIAYSIDGQRLVSGSQDQTVRIWDARPTPVVPGLGAGPDHVNLGKGQGDNMVWSPDSKVLATDCDDDSVKLWNSTTLNPLCTLPGAPLPLTFTADGKTLLTLTANGAVRYWDAAAGRISREGPAIPTNSWDTIAISADRRTAALVIEGRVLLWDITSGRIEPLASPIRLSMAAAFSADGRILACGGFEGFVALWDVPARQSARFFPAHAGRTTSLAISPDGGLLASGGTDHAIKLWEAKTGQLLHELHGHKRPVWALAFSPDGGILASGSGDHTVRLWKIPLGRELAVLRNQVDINPGVVLGEIRSLNFSPDGNTLASVTHGGMLRLFRAATPGEIAACAGQWSVPPAPIPIRSPR